jgi:Fic-DOC domain mobile mystery protein B
VRFEYPRGATPLDPDEAQGLIPRHITLQAQLNECEAENILAAESWAFGLRRGTTSDDTFLRRLHRRKFADTWRWAGTFRSTGKNLGVPVHEIQPSLRNVCADVNAQLAHRSMPIDEIAARFSHRLLSIHPFPNGNGRWSRLAADLLLVQHDAARFSWEAQSTASGDEVRARYLDALRAADAHDIRPLLAFARS